MATHDTIIGEASLEADPAGLAIAIQLPWYRSLWLSSVSGISLSVDGEAVDPERLRVHLQDREFSVDELPDQWDVLWFIQDKLRLIVHEDAPTAVGASRLVDLTVSLRLPYMQIAPSTYVRNVVRAHRELVAH